MGETSPSDRYTHMQWYLARSQNTVHFASYAPKHFSEIEFKALVQKTLDRAPQMTWVEDPDAAGHSAPGAFSIENVCEYHVQDTFGVDLGKWIIPRQNELIAKDKRAFKAICVTSDKPDGEGRRSLVILQTSHALIEGSDLAHLLRERTVVDHSTAIENAGLSSFVRMQLNLLAPILGLSHLVMSGFEKKVVEDFQFHSISVSTDQIARRAREIGVSRRVYLFAMVLYHLVVMENSAKRRMFAYSTLPKKKYKLDDDAYLNLRMQLASMKPMAGFPQFLDQVDQLLRKQNETEMVTQFLFNRVLAFQRRMQGWFPSLYEGKIFGYAPYDIVLSLLPPVRPSGIYRDFNDQAIMGGSCTGTVPNCIFLVGANHTTLNLWAPSAMRANVSRLISAFELQGIECHDEMKRTKVPQRNNAVMVNETNVSPAEA